jgi:hypothetical protein
MDWARGEEEKQDVSKRKRTRAVVENVLVKAASSREAKALVRMRGSGSVDAGDDRRWRGRTQKPGDKDEPNEFSYCRQPRVSISLKGLG